MNAVRFEDFKVPARHIAGLEWGTVNAGYRTNRRGAYYYSCSGHGGYVVDARCLSKGERVKIDRYTRPYRLRLLVQHRNGGGDVVIGVDCREFISCGSARSFAGRRHRYNPVMGSVEWVDLPIYIFEEDCDWAILEHLTDIRAEGHTDPQDHEKGIKRTFKEWCKPLAEKLAPRGEFREEVKDAEVSGLCVCEGERLCKG